MKSTDVDDDDGRKVTTKMSEHHYHHLIKEMITGCSLPSLLFLCRLHIQDGHHRATRIYHWTLWEFHSMTFFEKLLDKVNVPWMVLQLIYYFGADWKSNMAARANNVF
jgi:hypothetical protein